MEPSESSYNHDQSPEKMTILESLQNSREFPYGCPAAVGMLTIYFTPWACLSKNFEYFDSRSSISPVVIRHVTA